MNREKVIVVLKAVRNVLIALFSFGWVIPLRDGISLLFRYIHILSDMYPEDDLALMIKEASLYAGFSRGQLKFCVLWLAIVIGFWAFVAANKLWPIRKIPKPEEKQ